MTALEDPSAAVRYAAMRCAENLLPDDLGNLARQMLDDPHPRVADCAGQVLKRMSDISRGSS